MTLEQELAPTQSDGVLFSFSGPWIYLVPVVVLLLVHLVRALVVDDGTGTRWLVSRSLDVTPASTTSARAFVSRVRWTRFAAALIFTGVATLSLLIGEVHVGVVAGSYLLALIASELLAPTARRGRVRSGSLTARPRTYFAPLREVWIVRGLLGSAIPLALLAVTVPRAEKLALIHAVAMLLALVLFEVGLKVLTERGLPDRSGDLALDTAMRVATARTATAAALLGGTAGWLWSSGLASTALSLPLALGFACGFLINGALVAAVVMAVALTRPLRSWYPRELA